MCSFPNRSVLTSTAILVALIISSGCSNGPEASAPEDMRPLTASAEEVPGEVVRRMAERSDIKVKLKRGKDGTCTYEISGGDVDAVIEADEKLNAYIGESYKGKR